jgi:phage recombination protein Bet
MKQADSKSPHTGERESLSTASKELIEQSKGVTEEKIAEYLRTFGFTKTLLPNEIAQFTKIACEFQLNPFKREIYCVAYGENQNRSCSIIVGYEVYIKRAERTGKLDGWKAWVEGEGETLKAKLEIYRKDWQHPFTHEVYWREAVQKKKGGEITSFWSRMPRFQLKKVAISQGFRLCFPDELGGMPYDGAELGIETPSVSKDDLEASYEIMGDAENEQPDNQGRKTILVTQGDEAVTETPGETGKNESETPIPISGETQNQSSNNLYDEIRVLTLSNQEKLKPAHVEWIVNQLQEEKTEAQLRGLLKHVKGKLDNPETPAAAGKTEQAVTKSMPLKPANPAAASLKTAGEEAIKEIGEILNARNSAGQPYFSADEKTESHEMVEAIKINEAGLKELRDFRTFLSGELEKRKAIKTVSKKAA